MKFIFLHKEDVWLLFEANDIVWSTTSFLVRNLKDWRNSYLISILSLKVSFDKRYNGYNTKIDKSEKNKNQLEFVFDEIIYLSELWRLIIIEVQLPQF